MVIAGSGGGGGGEKHIVGDKRYWKNSFKNFKNIIKFFAKMDLALNVLSKLSVGNGIR